MESSIAVFLLRQSACELLPTIAEACRSAAPSPVLCLPPPGFPYSPSSPWVPPWVAYIHVFMWLRIFFVYCVNRPAIRGRGAVTFTRSLLAFLGSGSWPFACDLLRARNLLRARDLCRVSATCCVPTA